MGEKIKQYIEYKKTHKTHKVKIVDSKGNIKIIRVTIDSDAPLCRNAKDIIDNLFSHLSNLRD